ncbi:MAG: hypothetical protein FWH52_03550 [Synergistaceae bacterium]|nr:hypothetical protein [Synergistaceae bacterium]
MCVDSFLLSVCPEENLINELRAESSVGGDILQGQAVRKSNENNRTTSVEHTPEIL